MRSWVSAFRGKRIEGVIVKENCSMDEPIKLEIFTDYV